MKAWKLQECVAHSPGSVTCLSLGRKSGRVLVTGGEDRRVKLWAVGKPTCILSLTGHTSSVEAAEFSKEEDRVAAGSLSGSIRIWDLEEVKVIRALSGHTSAINTLDFHPFGNFVISGSMDTLVKLWDVSRKGCINTYRGHSGGISMLRFSPDGKWVASGAEDGVVKLWDLSAGRQLAELSGHTAPITAVAFHPNYLLLASASVDRTVRIFSLENFSQVAVSGLELAATAVRRIAFHPNGSCLYVATSDYLRIYDYETMACLETVHVGWRTAGGLDDMVVAPSFNQLVGVSITNSLVSTYVVDVKSCLPFTGDDETASAPNLVGDNGPSQELPASRVSALLPASDASVSSTIYSSNMACATAKSGGIPSCNQQATTVIQRPYTRCGSSSESAKNRKSFCLRADTSIGDSVQEDTCESEPQLSCAISADEQSEPTADINDPEEYARVFQPNRTLHRSPSPETSRTHVSSSQTTPHKSPKSMNEKCAPPTQTTHGRESEKPFSPPPQLQKGRRAARVENQPSITHASGAASDDPGVLPNFLPPIVAPSVTNNGFDSPVTSELQNMHAAYANRESLSESEWLSRLRKPHQPFMSVLSARLKNLSNVRVMWTSENPRNAVEAVLMMNEPAVLVDLLTILAQNTKFWNLDLVSLLLPHLATLIRSKYSSHVVASCQTLRMILKNFASLIRQTLDGPPPTGVDLMREERQTKCRQCMEHLSSIRTALDCKDVASRAGQQGRELIVLFQLLV